MTNVSSPTTLAQLVARSRKLGADRSICNWGGGNTSAKADEVDFRGCPTRILWVKGSGSDLANVTQASFTGLYLDDVLPLVERERMSDTEMVDYLAHCFYEPGRPRPSIETFLHGFLPFTHIDHTHADATNYFACAANGEALARDCFGDDLIWIPYRRPGFGLAREVGLALRANPHARLVILAKHGLITWGETDESCYASTMTTITNAREFVEARIARDDKAIFGGPRVTPLAAEERHASAAQVAPILCGLVSAEKRQILHFEDTENVLTFASSQDAPRLTKTGAACPDHLIHAKPWTLLVDWTPEQDVNALPEALRAGIEAYVAKYRHYLEANAQQNLDPDATTPVYRAADAAADPHPRVILLPGVGMFTTGKDALMADVSAQLTHRSIDVMRGAEACGGFISLSNAESYALEYWPLEQYKLQLAPPEREFARHVVLVTGARGGIGSAICRRVAQDGAHIVATDIDLAGAEQLASYLNEHVGAGRAVAVKMDVTNEESVRAAFVQAQLSFGGVDVIVNNAGLASSAPITEKSLAEWNKNWNVLATGYFLQVAGTLDSVGVDTWAIDYGLVDTRGFLQGNPFQYRDSRTDGVMEQVLARVARDVLYARTGIQFLPFNTLYQLYAHEQMQPGELAHAHRPLLIPDLLHNWLCGSMVTVRTNASTTQCWDPVAGHWTMDLLEQLEIPTSMLPPVVEAGTELGEVLHCVLQRIYLRQHNDQRYLVAFNVWAQEQVVKLSGQGQGRIVLSTCMNREGPFDLSELRLPWNEGASLNSWFRSSRYRFDWRHLMRAVID